jgi:hypothetical protein
MVFGLLGLGKSAPQQAPKQGLTNEGGIFAIINGIIEGAPEALGKLGSKVAEFTGAISDTAGSVFKDVTNVSLGGFTREEALPQQGVKLGRSADIHNAPVTQLPNKSPFEVTMNDVQVPALPMQVARSSGMGMNA